MPKGIRQQGKEGKLRLTSIPAGGRKPGKGRQRRRNVK